MLFRRFKIRLYVTIVKITMTYGYEAWRPATVVGRKLRTFEKKVWWKICDASEYGKLARKYNRELQEMMDLAPVTSFFKGQ